MTHALSYIPWYKRYAKFLAGLLGTATPAGLIGLLAVFGVDLDPALAVSIVAVLGPLATLLAPANKTAAGEVSTEVLE